MTIKIGAYYRIGYFVAIPRHVENNHVAYDRYRLEENGKLKERAPYKISVEAFKLNYIFDPKLNIAKEIEEWLK